MQAVVAIHDVNPVYEDRIKRLRDMLVGFGVKKYTYCVVPFFHGVEKLRLDKNPSFVSFLKKEKKDIALHGYTHLKVNHFSEEEFFRMSYQAAAKRIKDGLSIFRKVKIKPSGFVAPVWVASQGTVLAAEGAGFNYATWGNKIFSFKRQREAITNVVIRGNVLTIPSTVMSLIEIAKGDTLQLAFHPTDSILKVELLEELLTLIESKGYKLTDYNSFALSK